MADYSYVPDGALAIMAAHSANQVEEWQRNLHWARASVQRAEDALAHWTRERDEQFHALDERDIPAPGGPDG